MIWIVRTLRMAHGGEGLVDSLDTDAVVAQLTRGHQIIEDAEDFVTLDQFRRRAVQLQEIDGLGVQILKAAIDPRGQVLARVALDGLRRQTTPGFGRDVDRVVRALTAEPRDQALAPAVAIDVRGVDEVRSGVNRRVQCPHRRLIVDLPPAAAYRPRAKADDGHAHVRPAELSVVHVQVRELKVQV